MVEKKLHKQTTLIAKFKNNKPLVKAVLLGATSLTIVFVMDHPSSTWQEVVIYFLGTAGVVSLYIVAIFMGIRLLPEPSGDTAEKGYKIHTRETFPALKRFSGVVLHPKSQRWSLHRKS